MDLRLSPIGRCAELAGLRGHEIVLGVSPGDKHERILARYRRAATRNNARARLVADIRDAVDVGASRRAADLLIVLRRLLAERTLEQCETGPLTVRRRAPVRLRRFAPPRQASPARGAEPESGKVLKWRGGRLLRFPESVV